MPLGSFAPGARTMADEVVLVSFGEAPEAVADKIARISVPEGTVLDDAADTVISVFDAEAPAVVLVEPTRHMKTIAGKLAAMRTPPSSPTSCPSRTAPSACTSAAWPSACRRPQRRGHLHGGRGRVRGRRGLRRERRRGRRLGCSGDAVKLVSSSPSRRARGPEQGRRRRGRRPRLRRGVRARPGARAVRQAGRQALPARVPLPRA